MSRHDEAHSTCLNILSDSPHSAVRIAELCTFARALGGEIDDLRAQLAAENAELRKQCAAFHAEANDHYRAAIAANATLDALREEFSRFNYLKLPDELCEADGKDKVRFLEACYTILYPQPKISPAAQAVIDEVYQADAARMQEPRP